MSIRLLILLVAVLPVTFSRLPPVTRGDLDAEGQRLLDARGAVNPAPGPGHVTITVGTMMNAVDQHLPPERQASLPPLTRGR